MNNALRFADAVDGVTRTCGRIAAALLPALVAMVFFDVFGRQVIGASPVWLEEREWHVMAPIALLGITVLMLERGHVRVDMLYDRLPERAQQGLDLFSMLCGVVISVLFTKYSSGFVESAWSIGEGSPDPGGLPARYVVKAMIPVCFALFGLRCLANAIRHLAALTGRRA